MLSKSSFVRTSAAQPGVTWPLVTSCVQQWTTSPGSTAMPGARALFHLKWTLFRSRRYSATLVPPTSASCRHRSGRPGRPWPARLGEDLFDDAAGAQYAVPLVDAAAVLDRDRPVEAGVADDPQGAVSVVDEVVAGRVEPDRLGVDQAGVRRDAGEAGVERLGVDVARRRGAELVAGDRREVGGVGADRQAVGADRRDDPDDHVGVGGQAAVILDRHGHAAVAGAVAEAAVRGDRDVERRERLLRDVGAGVGANVPRAEVGREVHPAL